MLDKIELRIESNTHEDGSTNIPLTIILISQVREAQYGGDQEEHLLYLRSWEERLWQQECDFWGEFFLTSGSKGTNVNVPHSYPGSCQQGTQHVELSLVHRLDKGDIFYMKTWFPILPLPQVKDPTEFTGPESYVHSMVKVNVNCRQLKCIYLPASSSLNNIFFTQNRCLDWFPRLRAISLKVDNINSYVLLVVAK